MTSRRFSAKRHYVYAGLRHFANLAGLVAVGVLIGIGWNAESIAENLAPINFPTERHAHV